MTPQALSDLLDKYRDAVLATERESQWGAVAWEIHQESVLRDEIMTLAS